MNARADGAVSVASVILDTPLPQLDHPFDYSVPEFLRSDIAIGQKVIVPLRTGSRHCEAWVVGLTNTSSFSGNLASIESIVSPVVSLTPELYALARAVAVRQAGSLVDVLRLAIPQRYVRVEKEFLTSTTPAVAEVPETLHIPPNTVSVSPGQRISLQVTGSSIPLTDNLWVTEWIRQFVAMASQGVQRRTSCIITVPDFRDIESVERAFEAVGMGSFVVRTDAGIPGTQRWRNYLRILHEENVIVLGNRSSIYAPVKNLGLIAMWDSADDSYNEPLAPYAHPRDVALIRQAETSCSLVFAAHVPSVDTVRLESLGYLESITTDRPRLAITASDTHVQTDDDRSFSRIPPAALVEARAAITHGAVLISVARPGYASSLKCHACRAKATCAYCLGPLALKSKTALPSCRLCGKFESAWSCTECHSTTLLPSQAGTEKTAEDLGRAFPGVRVLFFDGDKPAELLHNEPALVISTTGTEPAVIGGYAAVLILDGESARSREDIDADSGALRNWMNAASLAHSTAKIFVAGSGAVLGHVLETGEFRTFALNRLREREQLGLPPATRSAVITGSATSLHSIERELSNLPHRAVLGPVPTSDEQSRIIVTFDYKDGAVVAKALRALILTTSLTNRKPAGARNVRSRVLRLNVRIDDSALRGIG